MVDVLMIVALAGTGLVAGSAAGTTYALVPMLSSLPAQSSLRAHGLVASRPDRFTPLVLAALAIVDGLVATLGTDTLPRIGFGLAAGLLAIGSVLAFATPLRRTTVLFGLTVVTTVLTLAAFLMAGR
jgi:hypothetical protein